MLQDALGTRARINTPGTVDPANWGYRMEMNVSDLMDDRETTERLAQLAREAGRGPAQLVPPGGTSHEKKQD
jgi:4-alpha-glucanotransferase